MTLALVILAVVVIAQQCLIIGLVNRLLISKGVPPLQLPQVAKTEPTKEAVKPRPIMTIPMNI